MPQVICDANSRFNGRTWDSAVRALEREIDDLDQEVADLRDRLIRIEERLDQ